MSFGDKDSLAGHFYHHKPKKNYFCTFARIGMPLRMKKRKHALEKKSPKKFGAYLFIS